MDRLRDDQFRILRWLRELSDGLAELYEGALRMVTDDSFPGRLQFVCHAVREIRNRLPEAVAGRGARKQIDYMREVDDIAEEWKMHAPLSVRQEEETDTRVMVPRTILVRVERLIKEHEEVRDRKHDNVRRMLLALDPENEAAKEGLYPVIKQWVDETEWFVALAHEGDDIELAENELEERFRRFEKWLRLLSGYFYEGLEEIESIVNKANACAKSPTPDEVDEGMRLLGKIKYRSEFFDNLDNPEWIGPLRERGYFRAPEEGESYPWWPEGVYLKKMASKTPEGVLEVISEIKSRNPYVRGVCIDCLLEMPESVAARGVEVVQNVLPRRIEEGDLGWFRGGKKAAELMVKLARSHTPEAFKIAWVLVDAWEPTEDHALRDMTAKFGEDHYEELIFKYYNKLFEMDAERATGILVKILSRYIKSLAQERNKVGFIIDNQNSLFVHLPDSSTKFWPILLREKARRNPLKSVVPTASFPYPG